MGLLLLHNCTLLVRGDMIRIVTPGYAPETNDAKRSAITGFSRESRKRLLDLMHSLIFKTCTFVTLTYPAQYPSDGRIFKAHLRAWRERLQRLYGAVRALWRLEFQERGAPHFHLLLLDAPYIDREWLSRSWYEVVGSGDERHLQAGTNIKLIADAKESKLVMKYVGKYTAKIDQAETPEGVENVGRYWGKWNIPKVQEYSIEVTKPEACLLVGRVVPRNPDGSRYEPYDPTSCTVYGDSLGGTDFATRVCGALAELRQRRVARTY